MVLNASLFCFTYYEGAKVRCFLSISDNGALSYPYFLRQSPSNRTTRAPARRKKGRKRGHPIFGATGHLRFQYGLLKWENNLNNFYNFEQRFAGTSPLRGPCRSRLACCETTKYNASPWPHFQLISPGVMSPRRFHSWNPCCILLFPLQQDCNTRSVQSCKLVVNVVFVVFPYSAGFVPAKVPFMEPVLYFVVYLCSRIATREA